jgi:ABC-type lipoprotein export system ATPase subunit
MPGQTLYIMGASGAGKTSLLNIISDRISLN